MNRRKLTAFTLLEMIVVIFVLGALILLVVPLYIQVQSRNETEKALAELTRITQTSANLSRRQGEQWDVKAIEEAIKNAGYDPMMSPNPEDAPTISYFIFSNQANPNYKRFPNQLLLTMKTPDKKVVAAIAPLKGRIRTENGIVTNGSSIALFGGDAMNKSRY